jgi:hypothetical protein
VSKAKELFSPPKDEINKDQKVVKISRIATPKYADQVKRAAPDNLERSTKNNFN